MTTGEFINKAFNGKTKKTHCSSVIADSNGDLFSYGYHYPLLFRVKGRAIRNVRGYSNTTAKHISWTRDIDAIDVHTLYGFRLVGNTESILYELIKGQQQYIESIQDQMNSKTRKDTQVYKWLEYDLTRANDNLKFLKEL